MNGWTVPKFTGPALCAEVDSELFFPEKGGSTKDAKKLCGLCDVRQQCLDFAVDNDERFGVWGGLSERERRRLRQPAPEQPRIGRPAKPIDHGTPSGYLTHRRRGEDACRACKDAEAAANRRRWADRPKRRHVEAPAPIPVAVAPAPPPEPVVVQPAAVRPQRPARPWTTSEARDAVHTLTGLGMSPAEIARELGLPSRTVARARGAA